LNGKWSKRVGMGSVKIAIRDFIGKVIVLMELEELSLFGYSRIYNRIFNRNLVNIR
jgi:hypothetical protein